ncbi:MAG: hypothetical protein AAF346_04875 [Pseudomonadota bacterium]
MNGIHRRKIEERELEEALEDIKSMELGALLNEDLERSRNSVLGATVLFLVLSLVNVSKVELFGFEAAIVAGQQPLILAFLFLVTLALCVYYHVNAKADYIDKRAARAMAAMSLRNHASKFEEKIKELKPALKREKKLKLANNRSWLKEHNVIERVDRMVLSEMMSILEVERGFESSLRVSKRTHYYIMTLCLAVQVSAFFILFWEEIIALF